MRTPIAPTNYAARGSRPASSAGAAAGPCRVGFPAPPSPCDDDGDAVSAPATPDAADFEMPLFTDVDLVDAIEGIFDDDALDEDEDDVARMFDDDDAFETPEFPDVPLPGVLAEAAAAPGPHTLAAFDDDIFDLDMPCIDELDRALDGAWFNPNGVLGM